jgi:hypothetical protein
MEAATKTNGYITVGHADGIPYNALGDARYVVTTDWSSSTINGQGPGRDKIMCRVRSFPSGTPHPDFNERLFDNDEDARRARYEAGVILYFLREGTPAYDRAQELMNK